MHKNNDRDTISYKTCWNLICISHLEIRKIFESSQFVHMTAKHVLSGRRQDQDCREVYEKWKTIVN